MLIFIFIVALVILIATFPEMSDQPKKQPCKLHKWKRIGPTYLKCSECGMTPNSSFGEEDRNANLGD